MRVDDSVSIFSIRAIPKMILLAQQGLSNDQIADRLSTRREIVSRWRKRTA
jgi:hypothetical protein